MIGGRRHARGYGLIVAVGVIALLSLLGMMVLDQVASDTQAAGAERAAQSALYIAEAGAVWGRAQLVTTLFGGGTTAQPTNLMALPPLTATDAICPENACHDGLCPPPVDCTRFFRLTPPSDPLINNGSYRVAVRCNPSCLDASPTYTVRSLGLAQEGRPGAVPGRLIEQTVGQ